MVHLKWCLENVLVGTGKHHGVGVVTQVALVVRHEFLELNRFNFLKYLDFIYYG